MKDVFQEVVTYVEAHRNEMLLLWETLVNEPSATNDAVVGNKLCLKLKRIFEETGFRCQTIDVGDTNAMALVGEWGSEREGKPILFSGHYDTVPLKNEASFYMDEVGYARGLGCLDMKGGIVIALFVVKALQALGWKERPVKFLFLGDEEKGHQKGSTPEVILKQAENCLCAFNMETGMIGNNICIGRKGGGVCNVEMIGVGAHAGGDFLKGRNAIAAMAYKITELQALTDLSLGTTVSVTLIQGGEILNSIPAKCSMVVDIRYTRIAERERVLKALDSIMKKPYINGCKATYEFNEYLPPFETNEATILLAQHVAEVSKACDQGEMGQVYLGGSSDAAYLTMAGVPTVCSMGVCGEHNHTEKEYAVVETLFDRTKLLACVVLEIEAFVEKMGTEVVHNG